jgi:hypothetical protein
MRFFRKQIQTTESFLYDEKKTLIIMLIFILF